MDVIVPMANIYRTERVSSRNSVNANIMVRCMSMVKNAGKTAINGKLYFNL